MRSQLWIDNLAVPKLCSVCPT